MLPRAFPPRSTVYGDFRRFGQDGVWHWIWMVLTLAARAQAGREPQPSAGIIDSQSNAGLQFPRHQQSKFLRMTVCLVIPQSSFRQPQWHVVEAWRPPRCNVVWQVRMGGGGGGGDAAMRAEPRPIMAIPRWMSWPRSVWYVCSNASTQFFRACSS
jgi:hypothetical protein